MKVVAFNGSPRKDGNTAILIGHVFTALAEQGIETELVSLADKTIHGCIACGKCAENRDKRCAVDDDANGCIEKMLAADGIVLGSPVYFQDVTPEMKALIDRAGFVARSNSRMMKNKLGAAVAALRRTGGIHATDTMGHFFLSGEIVIVGRAVGFGMQPGEVAGDAEGVQQARSLGERMAWLLGRIGG
jgi:multimeric flavodoxin WrbA